MMNHKFATPAAIKDALAARHADRVHHRELERELAAFSSPADRLEIETIVGRYSDDEAHEIREILVRQAA
jgi:hypothetical protein